MCVCLNLLYVGKIFSSNTHKDFKIFLKTVDVGEWCLKTASHGSTNTIWVMFKKTVVAAHDGYECLCYMNGCGIWMWCREGLILVCAVNE